jgi:transcriptional regulator GlxA family with amidase domain
MVATQRPRPINVATLAFEAFAAMPITVAKNILDKSSAVWDGSYRARMPCAPFNVEFVSLTTEPLHFASYTTLHPHASIITGKKRDLIFIPSAGENVIENLDWMRLFIPWIKLCARRGTGVVSLCTDAFLLSETVLLDGRAATTHWFLADVFRRAYPKVNLQPERFIVDEGNVITSGAATSFLDLALYLIELYNGHQAAVLVANAFLIERGAPKPVASHSFSGFTK